MKAKKRYVVGFWIATSLVVALAIGMVAVIAAFTGETTSGFNITYTAVNVKADVTMKHKVGSGNYSTGQTISFTGEESGDANQVETKNFTAVTVNNMSKGNDLIIHYNVVNKGSKFNITVTDNFTSKANSDSNLVVSFGTTDSGTWKSSLTDVVTASSVEASGTINFYVKVSIKDPTKSVNVQNASFTFVLAVV